MVAKCANPSCSKPFRYFHEGKLFRLEPAKPKKADSVWHAEWFWLCAECAPTMTLRVEDGGVVAMPLRHGPEPSPREGEPMSASGLLRSDARGRRTCV
jgi:hypothetical protein